jgi:molybdenum cofactor cytidylyltransferase
MSAAAIVLAAGEGRRFGSAKQLAPLHGRPLLQHVVDAIEAVAALRDVVVVLGARAEEVVAGIRLDGARIVRCGDWQEGMSASLRAGVAALPQGVDTALILLGDQPLVTPAAITRVLDLAIAEAADERGADAVRATYGGVPGHPVALGRRLLARVPALRGDAGARDLLRTAAVRLVPAGPPGAGTDVDTPEELEAIAR